MPKRNDGNEQDLRVRPRRRAKKLDEDNPFTGQHPPDQNPCTDGYGEQTQLPESGPCDPPPASADPDENIRLHLEKYNWRDVSRVCPRGFDNLSLDWFMMSVLKNHFSNPDCIQQVGLRSYIYDDHPELTKIAINMWSDINTLTADFAPAIIVRRGQQRPQRVVMGDNAQVMDRAAGERRFSKLVQGTHKIVVMDNADGLTEQLAIEVWDLFSSVGAVAYTDDIPFHDFQVGQIGELTNLEGVGQLYGVAIDLVYVYVYSWTIEYRAPTLARGRTAPTVTLDRRT